MTEATKFHIVISGRNTLPFLEACLDSVMEQDYEAENFRVTWLDDASTDGSLDAAKHLRNKWVQGLRTEHIRLAIRGNEHREGALFNYVRGARASAAHEVVVCLDGDDYLSDPGVLRRLDEGYQKGAWVVYAAFCRSNGGPLFGSGEYTSVKVRVQEREEHLWSPPVREQTCKIAGLRTFRAALVWHVHDEDLQIGGWWQQTAWDNALMLPMLEMAGPSRVTYIPTPLYVYRMHEGNDARQSAHYQAFCEWFSRARPSYSRIDRLQDIPTRTPRTTPAKEGMMFVAGAPYAMGVKLH